MTGNSSGSYRTTPARSMRAFDQLPSALRDALNNAQFKWADQQILALFRTRVASGGNPARVTADLVATLARVDAEAADQDAVRELRGFVRRARRR
jgi:hypothetical protein